MTNIFTAILLATCLAIVGYISNELTSTSGQQIRYCEMVSAWQETDGEYGWPDYNDNFDEVCTGENY
jgi:hypothetical protein